MARTASFVFLIGGISTDLLSVLYSKQPVLSVLSSVHTHRRSPRNIKRAPRVYLYGFPAILVLQAWAAYLQLMNPSWWQAASQGILGL